MKFPARTRRLAGGMTLALASVLAQPLAAAPYTPQRDTDIVERLPGRASDPAVRRVESLRKQLAARPDDAGLRLEIAQRYFEMAMAEGDPRYIGYASATIKPLAPPSAESAGYWLIKGQIEQFSHAFGSALSSLARASELAPNWPQPLAWRAAIFMVQARYPQALVECERLAPLSTPLFGAGCRAYVLANSGQLEPAFNALDTAVQASPKAEPALLLWQYTRLAEMAWRLERKDRAENYFRQALALGITDQFLLGAYSDFLLAQQRPAEVLKLLAGWERSDVLLLRLALAGRAAKDTRADDWAAQLRERFLAAAQRGDRLHEQEAARFALDLENDATKALRLASSNYQSQKEPRDAEILMRASLAARQPKAAQAALDWLRSSGYQDPELQRLADQLAAQGANR
jgi:hypothetical protein